jgi:predicted nuclease of restriction endonuclease-like (RecB) superfamily
MVSRKLSPQAGAASLWVRVRDILARARHRALQTVNTEMVLAYWKIGREIVQEEQRGRARADYGTRLIEDLSARLAKEFGQGFSKHNLWHIRQFYLVYSSEVLQQRIRLKRGKTGSSLADQDILHALRTELSWTHYRLLLTVESPGARDFYETEAAKAHWSTRELERQISSHFYERLLMSRDKKGMLRLAQRGHEPQKPIDLLKDPYVLEFTGLPEREHLYESVLEQALIEKLKNFLLELGRGFSFVARQKRITLDDDHHWIDLVFYHISLKRYVLIDLKTTKLTHQDIGQMQMYVHYFDREIREPGMGETIGILLCARKNNAVVKYTLPKGNRQIFASKYKLYLPSAEELAVELRHENEVLERDRKFAQPIALPPSPSKSRPRRT